MEITMDTQNVAVETDIIPDAQPGPSGLQQQGIFVEQNIDIEPEPEKSDARSSEAKLLLLSKMERKTAKAFKEHGIEEDFEWPSVNEERQDCIIRKHRNTAKLHAARQRKYRNPENEVLSQQRHQAHADHCRKYRNPEDEELSQQRHQAR